MNFFIIILFTIINSRLIQKDEFDSFIDVNDKYFRIAWSFYDRPMPNITRRIFDYTYSEVSKRYKYYYISYDNISSFLNLSEYSFFSRQMLPAHQSDFIRLLLLYNYGGWWIDTCLIVNSVDVLDKLYSEAVEKNVDLSAMCFMQCPKKLIENSFMYAPKGSILIKKWIEELIKAHKMGQSNYLYYIYRNGVTFPRCMFEPRYPRINPYMTAFGAQQYALERVLPRNTSIITHQGTEYIFKMHKDCKNNARCIKDVMNTPKRVKKYPLIKLNSWLRKIIFKGEGTVTAYDSFLEPHPLIKGSKNYKRILHVSINSFISNCLFRFSLFLIIVYLIKTYNRLYEFDKYISNYISSINETSNIKQHNKYY